MFAKNHLFRCFLHQLLKNHFARHYFNPQNPGTVVLWKELSQLGFYCQIFSLLLLLFVSLEIRITFFHGQLHSTMIFRPALNSR